MKHCNGCGRDLPIECFHRKGLKRDGTVAYASQCRDCICIAQLKRHPYTPEIYQRVKADPARHARWVERTRLGSQRYRDRRRYQPPEGYYSVPDLTKKGYPVSRSHLGRMCREGKLTAFQHGAFWYILETSLIAYLYPEPTVRKDDHALRSTEY